MPLIPQCCETPPVQAHYTPVGETFKLKDDLECYVSGSKDSKSAIIFFYDIYCFHPNAYQGADILAKSGFRVIVPDFLRNTPPSMDTLMDQEKFAKYVKINASYEVLKPDYEAVKNYLVNVEKFDKVFLIGFCLGAKMVMQVSAHDSFYLGGALVHPSLLELSDFENAQAPMIILPSSYERDFTQDYKVLTSKTFGSLCYLQRFDDMEHGWCAARGDWSDPRVASRANEAFRAVVTGFSKISTKA
ncbi:putative AIM2 family protein [Smittium mucronatum]|uniref:Putative AIM2 family protein n=1 Tax=Smittium mucronatum TaxID=133383 RepID=A0A1R0H0P5_9FUNG|nr:putative AIM2 family protein [Smittium mucronatum]